MACWHSYKIQFRHSNTYIFEVLTAVKQWYLSTSPHGVTTQKTNIDIGIRLYSGRTQKACWYDTALFLILYGVWTTNLTSSVNYFLWKLWKAQRVKSCTSLSTSAELYTLSWNDLITSNHSTSPTLTVFWKVLGKIMKNVLMDKYYFSTAQYVRWRHAELLPVRSYIASTVVKKVTQ
jgi:hypothetical protein